MGSSSAEKGPGGSRQRGRSLGGEKEILERDHKKWKKMTKRSILGHV